MAQDSWRALNATDLIAIAENMRASDRHEIFSTRFDDDIAALIADLMASDPLGGIVAAANGDAVAALGASEMWPGCWAVWMFATDRWPEVARTTTRLARQVLAPALRRLGARRAECRSALAHKVAHRWLIHLGAEVEAIHPAYGRNGETFIGFVFYGEKDMCSLAPSPRPNRGPRSQQVTAAPAPEPDTTDAGELELRRLRALTGRRATILTPEPGKLGSAPIGGNRLLGS
jgi:hypothetical protein